MTCCLMDNMYIESSCTRRCPLRRITLVFGDAIVHNITTIILSWICAIEDIFKIQIESTGTLTTSKAITRVESIGIVLYRGSYLRKSDDSRS